jgi:hypothetical protein
LLVVIAIIAVLNVLLRPPLPAARRTRCGSPPKLQRLAIAIEDDSDPDDERLLPLTGTAGSPSDLGLAGRLSPKAQLPSHNGAAGCRKHVETVLRE